jgi:hypothetical protein
MATGITRARHTSIWILKLFTHAPRQPPRRPMVWLDLPDNRKKPSEKCTLTCFHMHVQKKVHAKVSWAVFILTTPWANMLLPRHSLSALAHSFGWVKLEIPHYQFPWMTGTNNMEPENYFFNLFVKHIRKFQIPNFLYIYIMTIFIYV